MAKKITDSVPAAAPVASVPAVEEKKEKKRPASAPSAPSAPAPVAAPAVVAAPDAKAPKAKAAKAAKAEPVVAEVAAAAAAAAAAAGVAGAAATEEVVVATPASSTLTLLVEQIHQLDAFVKPIKALLKTLIKEVAKLEKKSEKLDRKRSNAKKVPSGFAKPSPLSPELLTFFSLPVGTELARTQVTSLVTKYIKENNLQQESDRRNINPDAPLKKLLKLTDEDKLTYFNLQRHLKTHFLPAIPVVAVAPV